jgi:hypothetical protein
VEDFTMRIMDKHTFCRKYGKPLRKATKEVGEETLRKIGRDCIEEIMTPVIIEKV